MNERMLATKRGREYARQIPLDRLLLETDAPAEPNTETSAQSLIRLLTWTSEHIASLKNCDAKHIESAVLANAHSVLTLASPVDKMPNMSTVANPVTLFYGKIVP